MTAKRLTDEESFFIKQTLKDRYQPESLIARGGMGSVFLGRDLVADKKIAIKILHTTFDPETIARFSREARVIALLDHPNIVKLYDHGTHRGLGYLILEFIEGKNLNHIINQGRLSISATVELGISILSALQEAHAKGIIHRDLKPSNILVRQTGLQVKAKLVDFGIAFIDSENIELTKKGEICGTPGYLSPEQIHGQNIGPNTDLYSLGIVLYECLIGRRAFHGASQLAILVAQVQEELPELKSFDTLNIPDKLNRILSSLLQKDASKRPTNIEQLLQEFFAIQHSLFANLTETRNTVTLKSIPETPHQYEQDLIPKTPAIKGGGWDQFLNEEAPTPDFQHIVDPQVFDPNPNPNLIDISFEFEISSTKPSNSTVPKPSNSTVPKLTPSGPKTHPNKASWEQLQRPPIAKRDFSNLILEDIIPSPKNVIFEKKKPKITMIPGWIRFIAITIASMAITFLAIYIFTNHERILSKISNIKAPNSIQLERNTPKSKPPKVFKKIKNL